MVPMTRRLWDEERVTAEREGLERQLSRDYEALNKLKDSLHRSDERSIALENILTSFEGRLERLEQSIEPIHEGTLTLTRTHKNIENSITHVTCVIDYFTLAECVEAQVNLGVGDNVEAYITNLDQVTEAINYFSASGFGSAEKVTATLMASFEKGCSELESRFKRRLSAYVNPINLSHLLGRKITLNASGSSKRSLSFSSTQRSLPFKQTSSDVGMDRGDKGASLKEAGDGRTAKDDDFSGPVELIRANDVELLSRISHWLNQQSKRSACTSAYIDMRTSVLSRTLAPFLNEGTLVVGPVPLKRTRDLVSTNLREEKQGSSSSILKNPFSSFKLAQSTSCSSISSSTTTSPRIGLKRNAKSKDELEMSAPGDSGLYERGSHQYLIYLEALLKMLQLEYELIQKLVPPSHLPSTWQAIVRPPLTAFINFGEGLVVRARRRLGTGDLMGSFEILDLLDWLNKRTRAVEKLLRPAALADESEQPYTGLVELFTQAARKILEDFENSAFKELADKSKLPKDGTVHEVASATMSFFLRLLDYQQVAESQLFYILSNRGREASDGQTSLSYYCVLILESLKANILDKFRSFESTTIGIVFVLNNINYIRKTIAAGSRFDDVLPSSIVAEYANLLAKQRQAYVERWQQKVVRYLSLTDAPGVKDLTKSDKEAIKERFRGFNASFEDVYSKTLTYSIPDVDLRADIRQDVHDVLVPSYKAFLARYKNVQFTKVGIEKYLKFTEEAIITKINSMLN